MQEATFNSIVNTANAQISALQNIDAAIDNAINSIKDKEWNKPLSANELNTIARYRSQKDAVLCAIEELGYVTLEALDKTDEVSRIANALTEITKDLNRRKDEFLHFGVTAETIGNIITQIGNLVAKLTKLTNQ